MKKIAATLILLILLTGTVSACGGTSDAEDFNALMGELAALTEYHFYGDVTIDFGAAFWGGADLDFLLEDLLPMRFSVEGTVSHRNREMTAVYAYSTLDGTPVFDMEILLREGTMYTELASMLGHMLRPVFEEAGLDLSGLSLRDMFGGYAYLKIPYETALADAVFAPATMAAGMDVTPFLTRDGDRFTLTFRGDEMRTITAEMSRLIGQFAIQGGGEDSIGDMLGAVGGQLESADLTDARAMIITTRADAAIYQTTEIEVPGLLTMRANFSFVAVEVQAVGSPANALTEAEFGARLLELNLDMHGGGTADDSAATEGGAGVSGAADGEVEIVYDLDSLNLLNHILPEDSPLTTGALRIGYDDAYYTVTTIYGAHVTEEEGRVNVDADAIGMRYTIFTGLDAVEAVLLAVAADQAGYFLADSALIFSVLRSNLEHTQAVVAIAEETAAGMLRVCVYLAQNIAGTNDLIRLELVFYVDLFTGGDHAIIAELSQHLGVNLNAYITELF